MEEITVDNIKRARTEKTKVAKKNFYLEGEDSSLCSDSSGTENEMIYNLKAKMVHSHTPQSKVFKQAAQRTIKVDIDEM